MATVAELKKSKLVVALFLLLLAAVTALPASAFAALDLCATCYL